MASPSYPVPGLSDRGSDRSHTRIAPAKYWNPYLSGIGLGLVLLITFYVMGRGLGASGAVTSLVAAGAEAAAPRHVESNGFLSEYTQGGRSPLVAWIVFEVAGVFLGGFISATLAGRVRRRIDRGPRISAGRRMLFAFVGGLAMGLGMILARGCTSGQGLTGGALLNLGSWVFLLAIFASAYGVARLMKSQWT